MSLRGLKGRGNPLHNMIMKYKQHIMKNILTYTITLLLPLMASAQALPFVAADYSPAVLAKAGADATETASTAFSAFGNVAAVPFSGCTADFAAGYTLWQPSSAKSNVIAAGGAYNLNDRMGFTLGLTYGMHPGYEMFSETGSSKGTFNPSDMQLKAGFAYRFLSFLSAGVNVGYASSTLAQGTSYGAFVADVFLMSMFSDFKVALGVSDLGSSVTSVSGQKFALPSALTLGLGYDKTFAQTHRVDVSVDADYYFTNAFAAAVGAGYTFNDMVGVKAGYRYGGKSVVPSYASLGLCGKFFGATIDLAYILPMGESPMSNTLAVSLGYRF